MTERMRPPLRAHRENPGIADRDSFDVAAGLEIGGSPSQPEIFDGRSPRCRGFGERIGVRAG
jgi:hypothetical protein